MAEAVAVIGLVASIASLVELSAKVVSRLHDFISQTSDTPESFRALSTRLPLLTVTLRDIQSQAEAGRFPNDVLEALKGVINDTYKEICNVQTSLSKVLPSDGASKLERALKGLKSLAKEEKVQQALEKIHKNNDILVLHQTTRILEALSKLNVTPANLPQPSSNISFGRDPDFVDRGALMDQLLDRYALPASRTALVGLGGVGKSQLAIELGYRIRERSPETWVLWVHAGSAARLEQSFRDIADYVEIPGRQDPKADIFKVVCNWLRRERGGRWLLILDNVDSPDLLSRAGDPEQKSNVDSDQWQPITAYLPPSQNGSILVTSRSKAAASKLVEARDIVTIQPMALAQALALCEKKLGSLGQGDDTTELAAALEFMPLAIVQAAAYICQRAPRYSVRQYLEDFRKSDRKKTSLLNYEGGQLRRDWQAHNSILVTWQISFEHVQKERPSAADLLSLMSFFDRQGIPEALVRERAASGEEKEDEEEHNDCDGRGEEEDENSISENSEKNGFEDDVQTLKDFSFLSISTDGSFEMHALVQLATRKWLEANGKLEQWKQCYIKNLSARFPTGEYENWTDCQALFPHVKSAITQRPKADESISDWALLLRHAAWYAEMKGNITEAIDLSEIAMKAMIKVFGQEHKATLSSIGMVGQAYNSGGRWKEAEELNVQVMEISQRVLGQEHPNALTSIYNLALTFINQGRWKEAEELEVQVIKKRQRVLGQEHPDTLTSISDLASIFIYQGRWKEAEELNVQVIEIKQRVLGQEHPDTLTSMNNLASIFREQGDWKEAEELNVQVIEIRQRVLGQEHPNTLTSMANLALTVWKQGRWKEAEKLNMQVMETSQRVLGQEHPNTLTSIGNLVLIFMNQGRWKEAEKLGMQVIETMQRVLGQEHPHTLTGMNNLALIFMNQGRWKEAEKLGIQVIEISQRVLGQEHPATLTSISNLASILIYQGRQKEAEELNIHVMETNQRVLGQEHPDTLTSMNNLAVTWEEQGRAAEAISLMHRCVQLEKQVLGTEHPHTKASLEYLSKWESQKTMKDEIEEEKNNADR